MDLSARCFRIKERRNSVVGFATLYIQEGEGDDKIAFAIRGISVVDGKNGLFVNFPSRKDDRAESGYSDVSYPCNKLTRQKATEVILKAFENAEEPQGSDEFITIPEDIDKEVPFR